MYRLLIVDDELPAVHALQFAIDWETHGFSDILMAENVAQAMEILMLHQVDMIICDIQMPGDNGIVLMHWVREHLPDIAFVFLSVHEDSKYISEAIHCGCLDYLLKPVKEKDLLKVVKKALAEIQQRQRYQLLDEAQEQASLLLGDMYVVFWRSLIFRELLCERDSIIEESKRRGLIFSDEMMIDHYRYFPILVTVREWHEAFEDREKHRILFAIRNVCEESIINQGVIGQFFRIGNRLLGGCFMLPDHLSVSAAGLENVFSQIHQTIRYYYSCSIQLLVGKPVRIWDIPDEMQLLFDAEENNVSDAPWQYCSAIEPSVSLIEPPDLQAWSDMVSLQANVDLEREIRRYFAQQGEKLSAEQLYQFRRMFAQMVYNQSYSLTKVSFYLIEDHEVIRAEEEARNSVKGTIRWCMLLLNRIWQFTQTRSVSEGVNVESICAYIDAHLRENLSREALAAHFFINPDYLGRLFKKKVGQGLNAYVQSKRINQACKLLSQTQLPIGDIGGQVGIPNFPYFCKLFKDMKGQSPQNYRKRFTEEEKNSEMVE